MRAHRSGSAGHRNQTVGRAGTLVLSTSFHVRGRTPLCVIVPGIAIIEHVQIVVYPRAWPLRQQLVLVVLACYTVPRLL